MQAGLLHKLKTQHQEMEIAIRVLERMTKPAREQKIMRTAAKAINGNGHAGPSLDGMTLTEAVPVALKAHGKPMKPKEIADLLRAGGLQFGKFYSSTLTTLKARKLIKRTKRGWMAA